MQGSGRGLTVVVLQLLPGGSKENHTKRQDNQNLGRDSKWAPVTAAKHSICNDFNPLQSKLLSPISVNLSILITHKISNPQISKNSH